MISARATSLPLADGADAPPWTVARSFEEIGRLTGEWRALESTPASDLELIRSLAACTPGYVRPYAVLIRRGTATTLVAGRIEDVPLPFKVGYRRVWCPRVRCLTIDPGAIVGDVSEGSGAEIVQSIAEALGSGEADMAILHQLPKGSELEGLARSAPGRLFRDHCPNENVRWTLTLPEAPDAPLPLSGHTRRLGRYYTNRLSRKYGSELRFETFAEVLQLERMMADVESVAESTYQRKIGVGFVDDEPTRTAIRCLMKRGFFRAFVLYICGRPRAFWLGFRHGDTFYAQHTGYDPMFAADHVGKVLLSRTVESLRAEGGLRRLDFGFGDAVYKSRWANERFEEVTVALFAPTLRGALLSGSRAAFGRVNALLRTATIRLAVYDSVRTWVHRRMTGAATGAERRLPGPSGEALEREAGE